MPNDKNAIGKSSGSLAHIQELFSQGQYSLAAGKLSDLLRESPDDPELLLISAKLDYVGRRFEPALRTLFRVTDAMPDSSDARHLLGIILSLTGQHAAAVRELGQAFRFSPDDPEICANLGGLIVLQSNFNDAEALLVRAQKLDPASMKTHNNLGILYRLQLRHEESIMAYRQAVQLSPDQPVLRGSLVRAYDYCPGTDPADDFEAARAAGELIEKNAPVLFDAYASEKERIRVGYIGSTLRKHSVTYFMLPVIENHSDRFEVFCYQVGELEDSITKRIAEKTGNYRHLYGQSAESIARRIHQDDVNILIDLDGFSEGEKTLAVLAHSPSPVQVSYLGWPNTTGLTRVGYRFVDHYTDPPEGIADTMYTEELIRLSSIFAVYMPPAEAPEITDTPALRNGYVTFGSFNWSVKMNPEVIRIWALILKAIPDSRLFLKHTSFGSLSAAENIVSAFAIQGVARDRLILADFDKNSAEHLARYHDVDITLDPFPFNGMTTSCEALWMGLPVVTLAGERHLSRVGVSLMNNLGFSEWIAENYDQYIAIAVELATDLKKLNAIRTGLRQRMTDSPLMDYEAFVEEFEQRLTEIWRNR